MTERATKPNVLFLVHRFPYPPNKGDKIRSFHLLKALSQKANVLLGCFLDDPEDLAHMHVLEELCAEVYVEERLPGKGRRSSLKGLISGEPLSVAWYQSDRMSRFVAHARRQGLAAEIAFSSSMAPYTNGAHAPVLLDLVDADSEKWAAYAQEGNLLSRLVYRREAKSLRRFEVAAINRSRRAFFVSPEEAALVREFEGIDPRRVGWFRNGIDTEYWRGDATFTPVKERFDVIFTGAMDYRPNVEAVQAFTSRVWPQLRQERPSLRFGIVGARPAPVVRALGAIDGVTVTGGVPDMRPYLAGAKVAVAPLSIARGIQNKVLEAMAMSVPVVASSGALRGIPATPGQHLLVADSPSDMVGAVQRLLSSPEEAQTIGDAAARMIREEMTWGEQLKPLEKLLNLPV